MIQSGVIGIWPVGRIGNIKTFQLPKNIADKISPEPKVPSLDKLRRSFVRDTGIYSSSTLRNARFFPSGFNMNGFGTSPLQSSGGLKIYTASIIKLKEGELIIALTGESLDIYG